MADMAERGRPPTHTETMVLQNFRLSQGEAKRLRIALAEADLSRQTLTRALLLAWMDGRIDPAVLAEPAPSVEPAED